MTAIILIILTIVCACLASIARTAGANMALAALTFVCLIAAIWSVLL